MYFKPLLKVAGVAFLTTLVLANDCDEIKDYLESHGHNFEKNIKVCKANDNGKVYYLDILSDTLKEEDFEIFASYDTIRTIHYTHGKINDDGEDGFHFSDYDSIPAVFTKLPNLEELYATYKKHRGYARSWINKDVLQLSKTLKKLSLDSYELSDESVEEISELTNLEEL